MTRLKDAALYSLFALMTIVIGLGIPVVLTALVFAHSGV